MVVETLTALRDALANDDAAEVAATVESLSDELRRQRATEDALLTQARAVRRERGVDDATQQAALELQQQVNRASASRGEVFTAVDQYTTGTVSGTEAAQTVADGISAHETLAAQAESFSVPTGDVPAVLSVTGLGTDTVPLGSTYTEPLRVENLGGSPTGSVSLTFEGDPDVSLSLSQTKLGELAPGQRVSVSLSGVPRADADLRVVASGDELSDTTRGQINVRGARELIGDGITAVFELLQRLRDALADASSGNGGSGNGGGNGNGGGTGGGNGNGNGGGPGRGFESKLEKVTKDLARAFDRIEDGDPRGSVDGKLTAAAETTKAFVASVEAQSGKAFSPQEADRLATDGRALAAKIRTARDAEIKN